MHRQRHGYTFGPSRGEGRRRGKQDDAGRDQPGIGDPGYRRDGSHTSMGAGWQSLFRAILRFKYTRYQAGSSLSQ